MLIPTILPSPIPLCSNVSLITTRINAAARTTVNTELTFDNALAVWRMPVSVDQELTAEMTVPAYKDYNIAFFDGSGNKLDCADTEGKGVDETLDSDNSDADADDYYKYSVSEGDVVTINASATDDGASLIYVALTDSDSTVLEQNSEPVSHYFGENEMSTTLTYTVPAATTELYVWMAAQPGTGSYTLEVQVD